MAAEIMEIIFVEIDVALLSFLSGAGLTFGAAIVCRLMSWAVKLIWIPHVSFALATMAFILADLPQFAWITAVPWGVCWGISISFDAGRLALKGE